jgi:hypothetical protein
MRPLNILTWHVHGNYLYYLSFIPHRIYVPFKPDRQGDYGGCRDGFPWPATVVNVPADAVRGLSLDCIIFQRRSQYETEQYEILSPAQRALPRIYLEHDPPQEHPTNTRHFVDDPAMLLVHVTPFNDLMWDSGRTPTKVIDHGVTVPPGAAWDGTLPRGLVVVNNIRKRGRRLGLDVLERVRRRIPLDVIGMGSEAVGGLGEVGHDALAQFEARYRFFFNPIRYTSLGLAVCEAMMIGMPVVALATTEMAKAVEDGVAGYTDTDVDALMLKMELLLKDHALAQRLGGGARRYALQRFAIGRFVQDWNDALALVAGSVDRTAPAGAYHQTAGEPKP